MKVAAPAPLRHAAAAGRRRLADLPGALRDLPGALRELPATLGRSALDLCLPPACPLCGADGVPGPGRLTPRCRCAAAFAPATAGWCGACGASLGPYIPDAVDCAHCRREKAFPFGGCVSLGQHEGELRAAVLAAKGPHGRPAARALGEALLDARGNVMRGWGVDLVAPVPHHWRDALARPFLPPGELAAALAAGLGVPHRPRLLRKVIRTARQASLTPTDRRGNLTGSFTVRSPGAVPGRRVLLCDDVLTTGTTARRATAALRSAGADAVFVAVFARGVGR